MRILKERLIELAEGELSPTAEEQKALASDAGLRRELEALRSLFTELKSAPAPEIDERALAGVLPAVRRGIERRRARSALAWITAPHVPPALARVLAASTAVLLLIGLAAVVGIQPGLERAPLEVAEVFEADSAFYTDSDFDALQVEASRLPGDDFLAGIEEALSADSVDLYFEETSLALMDSAAMLDLERFQEVQGALIGDGL